MEKNKAIHTAIGLLIFSIILLSHSTSRLPIATDSLYFFHVSLSIIREKNTNLDEYSPLISMEKNNYRVIKINEHYYNFFPIGPALISLPFVFLLDKIYPLVANNSLHYYLSHNIPYQEQHLFASFITALTAWLIYLIILKKTNKILKAILISFIFAFCTSAWSTASQTLWQHGPSMLMLASALYLFILAENNPKISQYTAVPLAFSYIIRPTNSVSIALFTILMIAQYRKFFLRYSLWGALIIAPFILHNISIYDNILPPYFFSNRIGVGNYFFEALLGNLISPNRGLFIFSPILLFSIYGIWKKIKEKQFYKLDSIILSIIILHWLTISSFHHWWGGDSFGPRFFTDMMPFLIYFLIPALPKIIDAFNWKNALFFYAFIFCLAFSFFVHYRGANVAEAWLWNNTPVNVDKHPARLWDWHDPQFLR